MLRIAISSCIFLGVLATCLFWPAGTVHWPAAWIFLGIISVFVLLGLAMLDPDLLRRRTTTGIGIKRWDLALAAISALFIFPLPLVTAGLDVKRYHWTPTLPLVVQACGLLMFGGGYGFALWAMRENRFFETFVRIQSERGQRVVSSGPYAYVRHPGYAGAILAHGSIPVVLGSRWAFVPAFCGAALFVVRTWLEDRTLQAELTGYREYAEAVRWRLIPGVW